MIQNPFPLDRPCTSPSAGGDMGLNRTGYYASRTPLPLDGEIPGIFPETFPHRTMFASSRRNTRLHGIFSGSLLDILVSFAVLFCKTRPKSRAPEMSGLSFPESYPWGKALESGQTTSPTRRVRDSVTVSDFACSPLLHCTAFPLRRSGGWWWQ